ncbi:MAG: PHP domain-containing protein [Vicinamibacterales bacterium]
MIDLHLHTTASDGRSTPAELVSEAAAAGIRTMAVTDHDTVAALPEAREAAERAAIQFVPGIEVSAVREGRDVHVLGYFIDEANAGLAQFLEEQRASRWRRVTVMVERLAALGIQIDVSRFASAPSGRAIGRPAIARALVEGGFASDVSDAFTRFLTRGCAAFVPREAPLPDVVIDQIMAAGGIASVAHPGKLQRDEWLPHLVRRGLGAIEAFHPDHSPEDTSRYLAAADAFGIAVTGGSDYHGPGSGRSAALGQVSLADDRYATLRARVEPA